MLLQLGSFVRLPEGGCSYTEKHIFSNKIQFSWNILAEKYFATLVGIRNFGSLHDA